MKNTDFREEIIKIPPEYKSGVFYTISKGNSQTIPECGMNLERWTPKEEEWCWFLYETYGYTYKQIAYSVDRPYNSVSIKMKRLKKKKYKYNEKHIKDKYECNFKYLELMKPKIHSVLDVFCGYNKYYRSSNIVNVTDNDINKGIQATYNMDATELLNQMVLNNKQFDLVDLDSFGATITFLNQALQIARYGLIMTLGELGHRRWKRLDFISKHYKTIHNVEDISVENFVREIIGLAEEQNITLVPLIMRDYGNIGRVWFEIKRDYK